MSGKINSSAQIIGNHAFWSEILKLPPRNIIKIFSVQLIQIHYQKDEGTNRSNSEI